MVPCQRRVRQHQHGIGQDRFDVHAASCSGVNGEQPVGDGIAHLGVVADGDDRGAARLRLAGSCRPRPRGSRHPARRSVRPAAGSDGRAMKPRARLTRCCSPPENVAGGIACSRRGMFSRSSNSVARCRAASGDMPRADQHLGHDVQRRHARHDAQELADIAERFVAHRQDGARIGGRRCRPSRRDGGPGCGRARRGNCRTGCASASTCRRRTGPTARRTRRHARRARRRTAPACARRRADAA